MENTSSGRGPLKRQFSLVPTRIYLSSASPSSLFIPFSTLEGFEGPGLGDTWQQNAAENSVIANQIGREDTLDRNPGFVNPQDITNVQDRQAMTVTDSQYQLIIDSVDTGAVKIDPQTQTIDSGQAFEIF